MSAYAVHDRSVGLPLFDVSCAPSAAALKLPYLRREQRSASVRRIYQSFIAGRLCTTITEVSATIGDNEYTTPGVVDEEESDPAACDYHDDEEFAAGAAATSSSSRRPSSRVKPVVARTSSVTVTYDSVLVADLHTGVLKHNLPLNRETCELEVSISGNWVGIKAKAFPAAWNDADDVLEATGGDVVIQVPVAEDQARFLASMEALVKHHSGGTAMLEVLNLGADVEAFREQFANTALNTTANKCHRSSSSSRNSAHTDGGESTAGLPFPRVNRQLWSVLNRATIVQKDRLRYVKSEFAVLDKETKQDLTAMIKCSEDTYKATRKEKREYRKDIAEMERAMMEEKRRALILNQKDSKITATKEELALAISNFEQHAVQFALEEQNWQLLLTTKQQEELKQKQALTTQERSNHRHIEETEEETESVEKQIVKVKEARGQYTSGEYQRAQSKRDLAIVDLEHATLDLEQQQHPKIQCKRRRVIESIEEELKIQDALRRLRLETLKEIEVEITAHADLIGDVGSFETEIDTFNDADLLLQAKQNLLDDELQVLTQKIQAVKVNNATLNETLEVQADERPLYVVTRSKLEQSVKRRTMVEESCVSQEKEAHARKTDLNQKIFDVRLRVAALKRHLE